MGGSHGRDAKRHGAQGTERCFIVSKNEIAALSQVGGAIDAVKHGAPFGGWVASGPALFMDDSFGLAVHEQHLKKVSRPTSAVDPAGDNGADSDYTFVLLAKLESFHS